MASSPAVEETGGIDLNAVEQERGTADIGAGSASDSGRDGNGDCLVNSGDGDSSRREAGDASCGDRDATTAVAEERRLADTAGMAPAVDSEGTEAGLEVAGRSGATEVIEGLDLREEKQNDVEDEVVNSRLSDECEGDQKPESDVVETGSSAVVAVEAAVAAKVEAVPDRFEPAEFGKTSSEGESIKKFESSSAKNPNLAHDVMAGNLVMGGIPSTEDEAAQTCLVAAEESGGQGKVQMDVMETEIVVETAKTMDAVNLQEVEGVEAPFTDRELNVGGEKDNGLRNENGAELVSGIVGCVSVDANLLDKLDVPDSTVSEMEDGSSYTHKPKVSADDAECVVENAATLTAAVFDGDEVVRLVDTSDPGAIQVQDSEISNQTAVDPGAIQVEVSEIRNQTAVEEGHLSHIDGNQIDDGLLQPEEGSASSTFCERKKKSCDDEKEEAGFVNVGCPSGRESSVNHTGVESENLEGIANQGDVEVGVVGISDRSEPTVTNHDFVDGHLGATEVDVGVDALDAGCAMRAAEADPLVTLVRGDTQSWGGTPDEGRAQVDITEISNGIKLPGQGLSIAEENQSLPNEVVNHTVVDGHLHATDSESADVLVNKNQEKESQTVSSLADNSHSVNAIGVNSSPGIGQNMAMEYKVSKGDESPTTEFCQNPETGRNLEADQKSLVLGGSIVNASPDTGRNDDQEMLVDRQETSKGTDKQTVKHVTARLGISIKDNDQRAYYYLPSKDEDGFSMSDLVWGKVKSHPWWPGQICDPSDASDLALKYQKKDNFLVAYFGDKTFAWCDESQLKHFETFFSQMEKQSSSDVFVGAVKGALDEVSRRMELGMTCFCFPEAVNANISCQKIENAGIREGSDGYTLDRTAIMSYFQPGRLLEYVKALAKFPDGGTDRLELVIANAQLKAFCRSKGYPELPSFEFGGGLSESDAEIPHSKSERIVEGPIEQSSPTLSDLMSGKRKSRGRGSSFNKQKHVLEDGKKQKSLSELMEAEGSQLANGAKTESGIKADVESVPLPSSKKRKITDSDSSDSGKGKKKCLDSLADLEIKQPSLAISSSFKVGECIRRVASQLTGSPPILKGHSETSLKNVSKNDNIFDVFVADGLSDNIMQSPSFKIENSEDYSSPDEMLSQLRLAARDPIKRYNFLSVIINFFTEFRSYYVSSSASEKKHPEKAGGKRGRKRKVDTQSALSEMTEPDHMQDSYWSDLISHNSPAKSKGEAHFRSQRKKRKSSGQTSSTLTLVPILQGAEPFQVGTVTSNIKQAPSTDRSIISVEEKMVDECTPTALILNFNGSKSLPSETDLIRIFSRYGPLKEAATEVQRKNNRVKVVFKRRADAEIAFSSAGKYSIFGPSLLSYRLRYLPSTPDTSPDTKQPDKKDALLVENSNSEIPDDLHSSMSNASPGTNLQDKSDMVLTESSNTNTPGDLRPLISNSSPDTNLQDKSDAVLTEDRNANVPSNLHPSMSYASIVTNLQEKRDVVLIESSNTDLSNNLHLLVSDAPPDTHLQDKSDAVLTENRNTNVPSHLHPPMSVASLDTNLQDKSDAVLVESNNTNLPGNYHPSMRDASSDTNLQDKSDVVLVESSNTNIPSDLHPSTLDSYPDAKAR